MDCPDIQLLSPETPELLDAAREILGEYARSLPDELLAFQNFGQEIAALPGEYVPPHGLLLLAFVEGELAGCGAFRPLPDVDYANACEMRRLYVRPVFRRFGLGRVLAEALIDGAQQAGYSVMLLDTLDEMETARGLYEALGFEDIPPYYFNPLPGAHYLKVELGC